MSAMVSSRWLVCVALVLLAADSALGQFGSAARRGVVESQHIVVALSASGKTVYAFSDQTGEWSGVSVEKDPTEVIQPVVGDDVACFVSRTKAYAFSAESGTWTVVDLGRPAVPVVSRTRVRIDVGSKIYLFSAVSEEWAVADLSTD